MVTNLYFYEMLMRFELGRNNPELLAKLDEQVKKENREYIKAAARRIGYGVKFPEE